MPLTRGDLQKQIEAAKYFFGLDLIESSVDKQTLTRVYKRKLNLEKKSDLFWSNVNTKSFLLLKHCVYFSKEKMVDYLFSEMVTQARTNEECNLIEIELQGLKSVCHARMCQIILKKFPQGKKPKGIPNMSVDIENITIPYNPKGKGLVLPPIQIRVMSLANSIKLSIDGQSCMIFILYHLERILEMFLKEIPVRIEELYTFPSQSSCTEENEGAMLNSEADGRQDKSESDSEKSGRSIPIFLTRKSNSQASQASCTEENEGADGRQDESENDSEKSGQISPIILTRRSKLEKEKKSTENERGTCPEVNPMEALKVKDMNSASNDDFVMEESGCSLCALINISENFELMVGSAAIQISQPCDTSCLEVKDSMESLVHGFFNLIADLTKLRANTMSAFKKNFRSLSENVLSKIGGSCRFYILVLERFMDLRGAERDRVVRLLNEITNICIEGQENIFENGMKKSKLAKRNITVFLFETGAIHSVHAVFEALHKMFKSSVDIFHVLPSFLSGLVDEFSMAQEEHTNQTYHKYLNAICRRFIKKYLKEKNIAVIEVSNKIYIPEDGVEFDGTEFIYFDKVERRISHFLEIKEKICSQCIPIDHLMFSEKENTLENDDWKFFLQFKSPSNLEILGTNEPVVNMGDFPSANVVNKDDHVDVTVAEDNILRNINTPKGFKNSKDEMPMENHMGDQAKNEVIETEFVIDKEEILKYWNPVSLETRKFHANLVGAEWPTRYKSVCCIVLEYNRAKKYNSRRRKDPFAKVVGVCSICSASHTFKIVDNPFEEILETRGITYIPNENMKISVTVCGKFFLTDDEPDISKPVHEKEKSRGRFCKGQEREILGKLAAKIGPVPTYLEQFDRAKDEELRYGNRSSIRSLPVIKGAKAEEDKRVRGGATFYESAKIAKDLLAEDNESPNFPMTNAAKNLPGFVRSLQEDPFKIMMANYDMMKVAGNYLNKVEESVVCVDSSGKMWQEKNRAGKNLLNTAIVIPPVAEGLSPFPIFEMVSVDNKTLDFIEMFQRAWGHMATAMNNTPVKEPSVAITDFSFPNLHAALNVFDHVKLEEYLARCFEALMKDQEIPFPTKVTICESHLIPILLKSGREIVKNKMVADSCVAGLLLVLRAPNISRALQIWEQLVLVHVSKDVNEEARAFINKVSKKEDLSKGVEELEIIYDIDDPTPDDEIAYYGDRKSMRTRSPFYNLFNRAVTKVQKENEAIVDVSNELYAPEFFSFVTKQYMSLFPFISASLLVDGLMTNAHVELHWKALRAQMSKISKSQQWPTVLLGQRHAQTRRQAKEILVHSLVPNLKFGGKTPVKKDKHTNLMQELSKQCKDNTVFKPTPTKKKRKVGQVKESFDGSREHWGPKIKKASSTKDDRYMKGKSLDHAFIESLVRAQAGKVRVTGNHDEGIILYKRDMDEIMSAGYIGDTAVGAGLLLLDKRVNDVALQQEKINVYSVAQCRIILSGEFGALQKGKFITILPRHMALSDSDDHKEATKQGRQLTSANGGHFTLMSNLFCAENECNVFETFEPFRNPQSLLNQDGKKLLRYLCNSAGNPLRIKCLEVNLQEENECGAIAFGLALQLCFYYHEGGLNTKFTDVRKHLLSCLKENALVDFPHIAVDVDTKPIETVLFSINI